MDIKEQKKGGRSTHLEFKRDAFLALSLGVRIAHNTIPSNDSSAWRRKDKQQTTEKQVIHWLWSITPTAKTISNPSGILCKLKTATLTKCPKRNTLLTDAA